MSFRDALRGVLRALDFGRRPGGPRRILLFGDSHVHAIQEAIARRAEAGAPVAIEARRLLKPKEDVGAAGPARGLGNVLPSSLRSLAEKLRLGRRTVGDTSFERFIAIARSLRPTDVIVSVIGGNQHAVVGTIQHPRPFDFILPGERVRAVARRTEIIPFGSLYDYFANGIRERDGKSLAALRAATRARIVQLQSPPPKGSNGFIKKRHDTQFAEQGISRFGVSSPELRMKFWKLQNLVLEELCAELDIELLPPPPQALDIKGFLGRSFYARDATHSNSGYGELVLAQLEDYLDLPAPPASHLPSGPSTDG